VGEKIMLCGWCQGMSLWGKKKDNCS
jgi:hypothetical protein